MFTNRLYNEWNRCAALEGKSPMKGHPAHYRGWNKIPLSLVGTTLVHKINSQVSRGSQDDYVTITFTCPVLRS